MAAMSQIQLPCIARNTVLSPRGLVPNASCGAGAQRRPGGTQRVGPGSKTLIPRRSQCCISLHLNPGHPGASREVQSVADRANQGQLLPGGPHPRTVPGILQKVLTGFMTITVAYCGGLQSLVSLPPERWARVIFSAVICRGDEGRSRVAARRARPPACPRRTAAPAAAACTRRARVLLVWRSGRIVAETQASRGMLFENLSFYISLKPYVLEERDCSLKASGKIDYRKSNLNPALADF